MATDNSIKPVFKPWKCSTAFRLGRNILHFYNLGIHHFPKNEGQITVFISA